MLKQQQSPLKTARSAKFPEGESNKEKKEKEKNKHHPSHPEGPALVEEASRKSNLLSIKGIRCLSAASFGGLRQKVRFLASETTAGSFSLVRFFCEHKRNEHPTESTKEMNTQL